MAGGLLAVVGLVWGIWRAWDGYLTWKARQDRRIDGYTLGQYRRTPDFRNRG
jgi:hypothetical protein